MVQFRLEGGAFVFLGGSNKEAGNAPRFVLIDRRHTSILSS